MSEDSDRALPVLPIRSTVLFPLLVMPLSVGRRSSLAAVEAAMSAEEKAFLVVAQRDSTVDEPGLAELYGVGTEAVIKRLERADGGVQMIVQGVRRVRLDEAVQTEPFLKVKVVAIP